MKKRIERFASSIVDLVITYLESRNWARIDDATKQKLRTDLATLRDYMGTYPSLDRINHLQYLLDIAASLGVHLKNDSQNIEQQLLSEIEGFYGILVELTQSQTTSEKIITATGAKSYELTQLHSAMTTTGLSKLGLLVTQLMTNHPLAELTGVINSSARIKDLTQRLEERVPVDQQYVELLRRMNLLSQGLLSPDETTAYLRHLNSDFASRNEFPSRDQILVETKALVTALAEKGKNSQLPTVSLLDKSGPHKDHTLVAIKLLGPLMCNQTVSKQLIRKLYGIPAEFVNPILPTPATGNLCVFDILKLIGVEPGDARMHPKWLKKDRFAVNCFTDFFRLQEKAPEKMTDVTIAKVVGSPAAPSPVFPQPGQPSFAEAASQQRNMATPSAK